LLPRVDSPHRIVGVAAIGPILILAACLRLWRLELVEFKNDEAAALRLAENLVRLGRIPLVGLRTSLGAQSPPEFITSWPHRRSHP
jgi:hypothetical protein